jgi:hypothetical protein
MRSRLQARIARRRRLHLHQRTLSLRDKGAALRGWGDSELKKAAGTIGRLSRPCVGYYCGGCNR